MLRNLSGTGLRPEKQIQSAKVLRMSKSKSSRFSASAVSFLVVVAAAACTGEESAARETRPPEATHITTAVIDDTTTTTLSEETQTAKDEQLFREVLYAGQQRFGTASGNSLDYETWWNFVVDHLFPPYRNFVTDRVLTKCLERDLGKYSSFTVDYGTLEIGSSFPTPNWTLDVDMPDGTVKSFRPSEFGRTYLVRATFTSRGYNSGETTSDIHYVIIDDRAYYFSNLDFCLDLK